MKGIILAGGNGRRLSPLTDVTNKHLLAVYNKPMIYYPLHTLVSAGIKDILIVTGREHAGDFLNLLRSGRDFGCRFTYEIQEEAGGIAEALGLAEDFARDENVAVILGDNIFEDEFVQQIQEFEGQSGARLFLKEVDDPKRFGVAELEGDKVKNIVEKPEDPKSNFAVTGLYLYDKDVFKIVSTLKPSGRGELEITDVNNHYVREDILKAYFVEGHWTDGGTFESLYRANRIARTLEVRGKLESVKPISEEAHE